MRTGGGSRRTPSVMPVDAAGSLPSVQLGDEAVVQLAGIIRIEMKAAAFIAAHGAVYDQGGHRHQVAQFQNVRRNAVSPVEVLYLPVQHPEPRGCAVQPFIGPHNGDVIPHQAADKIQKMINQIDSCLGGDVDLMLQDPQIGPSCKKIQELQAQYKKELQALYNTVKHGTELLDVDAILHGGEVLLRRFGENTQEELQIINKLVATSQQYQRLQEEREILAQTKRKKIVRISNDKGVDIAVSDADIQEQISVFDDEIKEFMTSPMTSKHKNSILLINQDLHELEVSDLDNDRKSKRIQRLWLAVLFG